MKKISREAMLAKATKKGYDSMSSKLTIIDDAVFRVYAEAGFKGAYNDVTQILIDGSLGKIEWFTKEEDALIYFADHIEELNDALADVDTDIINIIGTDKKDRLCLGTHNRKTMAQWLVEYAVGIIAEWFGLEY